jgi:16S rRNA (guanine1207-N2)-methyltransferase
MWLVANRHLPYEQILNESFGQVRVAAERDGFKLIQATKASKTATPVRAPREREPSWGRGGRA